MAMQSLSINMAQMKRTKRQRDEMSLIQQVAPGAVAGSKTLCHLPPCVLHMTLEHVLIDRRAMAVYQCLMKAEAQS